MKTYQALCALLLAVILNVGLNATWAHPDVRGLKSFSSRPLTKSESSSYFPWLVPYKVNYRPEILNILANRTLTVGNGASIKCRVSGNPRPRIKWKKNGVTIEENKRVKARSFVWGSRLRIRNVQKSDAGIYRCIAKNAHGNRASSPAYIRIRDNKRGRCEVYTGSLCNTNLFHLTNGQSQHKIEKTISKTINSLKGIASPKCIRQLTRYLCRQNYPSCTLNSNNKPRKICQEDCHELEKRACRRDIPSLGPSWRRIVSCANLPSVTRQPGSNCQQVFGFNKPNNRPNPPSVKPPPVYSHHHLINQCASYNGERCKSYVAPGTMVLLHGNDTQTEVEKSLDQLFKRLHGYVSANCGVHLTKALCYHLFSPCSNDPVPKPKHICRLECEILQGRICSKEFQLAKLFKQENLQLPKCYTLPPNKMNSNERCMSIGINVNNPASNNFDSCSTFLKRIKKTKDSQQPKLTPLKSNYKLCPKGVFDTPLTSKLPKTIRNLLLNLKNNILQSKIAQTKQNGKTIFCIPINATLNTLTRNWKNYHNSLPLPKVQIQPQSIKIPGIEVTVDHNSSVQTILVPLGSVMSYEAHAKILLENVSFFYRYRGNDGAFVATGKYRLCESVFDVVLVTFPNGTIRITGNSSSPLDISTIERVFGLAKTSSSIHDVIRRSELLLMRLINPSLDIYIDSDLAVKFSGQTYFGTGALPTFLEFHCGKFPNREVLVTSLSTQGLAFNDALKIFTGHNFPSFDWMSRTANDSQIGVLLSTESLQQNSRLQINCEPLTSSLEGSIPSGLTMIVTTRVPNYCDKDRFCELVKAVFGQGSQFKVKIISNEEKVSFEVGFDKAAHHSSIKYKKIQLSMEVVKGNMSFDLLHVPLLNFKANGFIQMSRNKSKTNLFLYGELHYDGIWSQLTGNFQINEHWINALGIRHLILSNLRASFSLPTGSSNSGSKHMLNTRGDFTFGSGCSQSSESHIKKSRCITGQAFLGFSDDISQHYFYGTLGPVSLKQLLDAYGVHVQLPDAVKTIGFPNGLKISVSRDLHDERIVGGPLIYPGFLMTGRLRILGIETDATISLTPREFLIDADVTGDPMENLKPIDAIEYARTKLYMKTRMNPNAFVKININGYSRIFGIFDAVDILVSSETTQIKMVAEVHKSIYAHVYLTSNYSQNRNKTHLEAKIIFRNKLSKLTRLASKHIVNMLETEMSKAKMVEKEVKQRSKECAKSSKKQCMKCLQRTDCFNALVACYNATRPIKNSTTVLSKCQKLLVNAKSGDNVTCQAFRTVIGQHSNSTCSSYHEATRKLQKLQNGLKWVRQARALVLGNLFNLHSISFEAEVLLTDLRDTVVETTFDVTIFGQRNTLRGLRLRLESFSALAAEIANKAYLWYGKRYRLYGN